MSVAHWHCGPVADKRSGVREAGLLNTVGLWRATLAAPPLKPVLVVTTTGAPRDVDALVAPEIARAIATTRGEVPRIALLADPG